MSDRNEINRVMRAAWIAYKNYDYREASILKAEAWRMGADSGDIGNWFNGSELVVLMKANKRDVAKLADHYHAKGYESPSGD